MIQLINHDTNKEINGSPLVGLFFCHEIGHPDNQKQWSLEAVTINGDKSIGDIIQDIPNIFNKQPIYIGSCLEPDRLQLRNDRKQLLRTHQGQSYQSMVNHLQRVVAKTTNDIQQLLIQAITSRSSN